jgi:uroporphyrin-III C-methyltransferase/precorrin-2 dehydrogenase/sirohydrochlorin ferrochelatase
MSGLPIVLSVEAKAALVVGGQDRAVPKVRRLLAAGADVRVIARAADNCILRLAEQDEIVWEQRDFAPRDVEGAAVVFAATGIVEVDGAVASAARTAGTLVNVVDGPEFCDFSMPAIVDRDPVMVAISTDGAAPLLARKLRARIEAMLPENTGGLARFAAGFRSAVAATFPDARTRRRVWETVFEGKIADIALSGDLHRARREMLALINSPGAATDAGHAAIVGAGPGDPDLLTLRASRLLEQADVVIHDRLVGERILGHARRDATLVDAGKAPGHHKMTQDDINQTMIDQVRAGNRVVRLKGGDPFVFGRGGEEVDALRAAGLDAEIVPGITAALGCSAAAGIPLTHRDHAHALTLVTGQGHDGAPDMDWASVAQTNHTIAVYMGVANAGEIAARLIGHGRAAATPVAVIENGTLPEQRILASRLDDLGDLMTRDSVSSPALVVIGEVTAYANIANQTEPNGMPDIAPALATG